MMRQHRVLQSKILKRRKIFLQVPIVFAETCSASSRAATSYSALPRCLSCPSHGGALTSLPLSQTSCRPEGRYLLYTANPSEKLGKSQYAGGTSSSRNRKKEASLRSDLHTCSASCITQIQGQFLPSWKWQAITIGQGTCAKRSFHNERKSRHIRQIHRQEDCLFGANLPLQFSTIRSDFFFAKHEWYPDLL
jgi:hypothetical protein